MQIPDALWPHCVAWAERFVASYRDGGPHTRSSRGMEYDVLKLAQARAAECFFALYLGLDPLRVLGAGVGPDAGYDLVAGGVRYDVKWTKAGHYLTWPAKKVAIFDRTAFDRLVLVKGEHPDFEIAGWIGKDEFRARHGVAGAEHILDPGTWFMHELELRAPGLLRLWRAFVPSSDPRYLPRADVWVVA